ELADELRRELAIYLEERVAAAQLLVVPESSSPSMGDPIEIQLIGPDMDTLLGLSREVQTLLAQTAGVVDVRDNIGMLKPERARVAAFPRDVRSIAMQQLLSPSQSESAIAISHVGGERALTVMAKNEGRTVSEVFADVQPQLDQMQQRWPSAYRAVVGGEAADTTETFSSALLALVIAVVLVVGVLVILFSSFRQAFIIFATMPLAIIGSALGFWAFDITFSFFAMIGLVS